MINIRNEQQGTAITETVCIIALIALAALSSLGIVGNSAKDTLNDVTNALSNRGEISPGGPPTNTDHPPPPPPPTN